MGRVLIGVWDCPACGTKGVRGDVYTCPNCGRVRAEDTKFYLPEGAAEVTEAAGIAAAKAGPDWLCDFCGNLNAAASNNCEKCSAARGSEQFSTHEYAPGAVPRSAAEAADDSASSAAVIPAAKPRHSLLLPAGILLAIAALVGLGLFLFLPRESIATISGKTWERSIRVESLRPMQAQDWAAGVPADAADRRCTRAVRTYIQVQTGTRTEQTRECHNEAVGEETYECGTVDLGNGRFETKECTRPVYEERCEVVSQQVPVYISEPVYDDYCTYTVVRWQYLRTVTVNERDTKPYWPVVEYAAAEREEQGGRTEVYVIYIVDHNEKTWEHPTDLGTWQRFSRGQKCTMKVNRMNEIVAVEIK
jgi:hypothetical protein